MLRWTSLVLCIAGCTADAGEIYRNEPLKFKVTVPDGWVQASPWEVKLINEQTSRMMPGSTPPQYFACFRRASLPVGSYPYVLLQDVPMDLSRATAKQLDNQLSDLVSKPISDVSTEKLPEFVQDARIQSALFDRQTNRVSMRLSLNFPPVGLVNDYTVGHIGRNRIIFLHSYSAAVEQARNEPKFREINDSFRFDEGASFVPAEGGLNVGDINMNPVLESAIRGAIIGAVVGGVIAIFHKIRKRRKSSPADDYIDLKPTP